MAAADGTYTVDNVKMREGIWPLATELLTLQATGDYARAQRLLTKYGVMSLSLAMTDSISGVDTPSTSPHLLRRDRR